MNTCFTRGTAAKELITHSSSKSRTASKCIFLPGNIRPPDRLDYFPTFLEATATKVRRCQTRHASTLLQAKSRVDGHFVGHRATWGLGLFGNRAARWNQVVSTLPPPNPKATTRPAAQ